jgi:prepilin-type N-terminal cleavage/methylation domain-containing protein
MAFGDTMQGGSRRPPGIRVAERGFTLLELMVVVTLIAILLGVAMPRLGAAL